MAVGNTNPQGIADPPVDIAEPNSSSANLIDSELLAAPPVLGTLPAARGESTSVVPSGVYPTGEGRAERFAWRASATVIDSSATDVRGLDWAKTGGTDSPQQSHDEAIAELNDEFGWLLGNMKRKGR
ncbi:MAG: hypothetical protein ACTHK7_03280 [Aureliella sp.]